MDGTPARTRTTIERPSTTHREVVISRAPSRQEACPGSGRACGLTGNMMAGQDAIGSEGATFYYWHGCEDQEKEKSSIIDRVRTEACE